MEELLTELRVARLRALAGELDAAVWHVHIAFQMVDGLKPRDAIYHSAREVRGYIAEAGFALLQADSRRAISALDETLRALESKLPNGG
jgi:hypothetical protein